MSKKTELNIAFLSTWPEIKDGISTFCENLAFNLPKSYNTFSIDWSVIKVDWIDQKKVICPEKIIFNIDHDKKNDYLKAANFVNESNTDLVVIQFINSIYGDKGRMILDFIDNLRKPFLIILHSVAMLPEQSDLLSKQELLKDLAERNANVIVMTKAARGFLIKNIGFKSSGVNQIYHGAPVFKKISQKEREELREGIGFSKNDKIVYCYGILREDKGIEEIIRSIKIARKEITNIKLLITGGDQSKGAYIAKLKKLISDLKLQKVVKFVDKFIPQDKIGEYLQMSDLHVIAQKNLGLHSSGTLAYALSAGSVIISTPTMHAKEILKDAGVLVPQNDTKLLAKAITDLLTNPEEYSKKKKASTALGQEILWPNISKKYLKVMLKLLNKEKNGN